MKFSIKYSLAGNMQTSVDIIVKSLFQKNSLHDVQESELEEYIQKFPFAAVGYLLLTRKKKESGVDYRAQASKSALFVSNPLWIHSFLQNEVEKVESKQILEAPTQETSNSEDVKEEEEKPNNLEAVESNTIETEVNEAPEIAPNLKTTEPETNSEDSAEPDSSNPPELPALKTDLAKLTEPVAGEALSFEPYHTIDYFASQGIKLRAEDLTKDKFGRQLKSFTEWLRTMKRVGPVTADNNATPPIDEAIVKKAEASVENNDVETEAMAEVWAKQGKMSKAIEIYQKLSLLNPSKSHYFAAKIEQLKA